ncbi:MAG: 30S ribosomal protein S7 [Patescibacteria group bacterium]
MRRPIKKRNTIQPDPRHGSLVVAKFINKVMVAGKKSVASRIVYGALDNAAKKAGKTPNELLEKVLEHVSPTVELKSRRVGGANYQVPIEVRPERRLALAIRWIVDAARSQKGKNMHVRLSEEFLNAFNNTGTAVKKRADVHRMADANKAFAHLAW